MENELRHCCAPKSQISISRIRFAEEVSDLFSRNVRDLCLPTEDTGSLRQTLASLSLSEASLQLVKASEGKARTYIQRVET